jgi:hypothetical protein
MSISRLATNGRFFRLSALAMCVTLIGAAVADAAQGQRGRTYSKSDVEKLIEDVEESGKDFRRDFDSWLDRSSLDGNQREDRYNRQVTNLTNALSTLRSNFDNGNDWWLARTDMQRVLNEARPVDSLMRSREVRGNLDRQWGRMRRNLNRLADAFNLPPVGSAFSGNRPNYPNQGGNVPNWAIGTFRGWTNTGEAELTIAANGVATARSLTSNALYTGRAANDVLYFDWGSFNVVREGGGISTVEIGNQQNRTSYRRVAGYPGDQGPGYPDQGGNVPNWAIGTFRGQTNNGESELTIASNGVATARSLNTNALFTGRYANDLLSFDWGSFRLVREGRGIRTVDVNNPNNTTSYRRVDRR